ncbi:hypothetical protein IH992_24585 [Candidatus Poribacteria bacterium]|nr:hypothetical protein [Candidatus Poribacteria bacterium]
MDGQMIPVDKTDSNILPAIFYQPDTAGSVEDGLKQIQHRRLVATASGISSLGWRVSSVEAPPLDDKNALYYHNHFVTTPPRLSAFNVALEALNEVMQEAKEISQLDSDTESIPQQAYEDTKTILRSVPYDTLSPEFTWLIDGGIGIEWVEDDKIFALSLYGDGYVIFVGIFDEQHKIRGKVPLTELNQSQGFFDLIGRHFYRGGKHEGHS